MPVDSRLKPLSTIGKTSHDFPRAETDWVRQHFPKAEPSPCSDLTPLKMYNRSRCQGYGAPLEVSKLPSGENHSFRDSSVLLSDRRKTIADQRFPCRALSDQGNLSSFALIVFSCFLFVCLPLIPLPYALSLRSWSRFRASLIYHAEEFPTVSM